MKKPKTATPAVAKPIVLRGVGGMGAGGGLSGGPIGGSGVKKPPAPPKITVRGTGGLGAGGGFSGSTGTVPKHAPTAKHKSVKHKPTAKHQPKRKWSPDGLVACCAMRAVAEAIRLTSGVRLSDADVLGLYFATTDDPDAGQTILEALTAAEIPGPFAESGCSRPTHRAGDVLILGLDLPWGEAHAVTAHDGIWWSWGEPYTADDFPGAVIEEAWTVTRGH